MSLGMGSRRWKISCATRRRRGYEVISWITDGIWDPHMASAGHGGSDGGVIVGIGQCCAESSHIRNRAMLQ